jgi:hypothetical protein
MGRYGCMSVYRPAIAATGPGDKQLAWSGRSSQSQVSLVSLMTQGGQRAHGTIQPTNNHQRAGYRPERNTTPVLGSGADCGDIFDHYQVPVPYRFQFDGSRACQWWPLSLCCRGSRTLDVSASALSVSAIVLSMSTCVCVCYTSIPNLQWVPVLQNQLLKRIS